MLRCALLCVLASGATAVAAPLRAPSVALPDFLSREAAETDELEARVALSQMQRLPIPVAGDVNAKVQTSFWESQARRSVDGELSARLVSRFRTQPMLKEDAPSSFVTAVRSRLSAAVRAKAPRVLLLHGADASSLEWRHLVPKLNELGVSTTAVDWWSGGWTDRRAICERIDDRCPDAPEPWTLVQQHLHAFWREQLNGEPVIVVGASLGGAVALDFAASHPEAVAGLVLLDAGGESYASPPPGVVSALAPVALGVKKALAFISARVPNEELRINNLHRSEPLWAESLGKYLSSGGYARAVDRELIRTRVPQPTLVVWGDKDPILPLSDAYAFERDLPRCVGVREVPGCGHTPQLEDPDSVALHVAQFALELSGRR